VRDLFDDLKVQVKRLTRAAEEAQLAHRMDLAIRSGSAAKCEQMLKVVKDEVFQVSFNLLVINTLKLVVECVSIFF